MRRRKGAQQALTSVEEIFQFELLFAKLFGGFNFEWPSKQPWKQEQQRWLALAYRLALVVLARYLTPKHFMTSPSLFNESLGQVPMQNFKLFYYICQTIGYAMVFVNIHTGFKSHQLMLLLLKKRFDANYLTNTTGALLCQRNAEPQTLACASAETLDPEEARASLTSSQTQPQPRQGQSLSSLLDCPKVLVTRYLLAANLLVSIYSVYVHRSFVKEEEEEAGDGDHSFGPTGHLNSSSTMEQQPRLMFEFELRRLSRSLTNLLIASLQAALNLSQMHGQIFVALLVTTCTADILRYSLLHDEHLTMQPTTTVGTFSFASTSSSTLTVSQLTTVAGQSPTISSSYGSTKQQRLLTTQVLMQTREVLLVLRHSVSVDYLMVLLLDLARFGAAFCLLNESLFDPSSSYAKNYPLIAANFALVFSSLALTRIGHRFVHYEMARLINYLEKTLVMSNRDENAKSVLYSATSSSISTQSQSTLSPDDRSCSSVATLSQAKNNNNNQGAASDQLTALRLAREISNIWPTDWYTPDYVSCMEQIIYVITFVATFHQLAEASLRVDNVPPL